MNKSLDLVFILKIARAEATVFTEVKCQAAHFQFGEFFNEFPKKKLKASAAENYQVATFVKRPAPWISGKNKSFIHFDWRLGEPLNGGASLMSRWIVICGPDHVVAQPMAAHLSRPTSWVIQAVWNIK